MSKNTLPIGLVIEWSNRGVAAYDVTNRQYRTFDSLESLASAVPSRDALVAVSRKASFIRTVRVPNASPEEINTILMMMLPEILPMAATDLAYTSELTDDINPEGRLAIVAAIPASDLRRLHDQMQSAGIRVRGVLPAASGASLLLSTMGRSSGAVVQETSDGISIDLVVDGKLRYSRLAAAGGRLEAEVCRTFQVAGLPCGDIVAAGTLQTEDADMHTSATTLEALVGGWDTVHLNLELPEVVAKRSLTRVRQRQRFAGLMAVAAIALAGLVFADRAAATGKVDAQDARNKTALATAKKLETAAEKDMAAQKILFASLTTGLQPAQPFSDVITLVSNRLPDGVWLAGVSVERGKILSMRGTAKTLESVTQYLDNLGKEPRLRDVQLVFSNNGVIDTTPVVQFSISAFPVGNLPLTEGNTKRKS